MNNRLNAFCPNCSASNSIKKSDINREIKCEKCGIIFVVPKNLNKRYNPKLRIKPKKKKLGLFIPIMVIILIILGFYGKYIPNVEKYSMILLLMAILLTHMITRK